MSHQKYSPPFILILLLVLHAGAAAQEKKPLDHTVYNSWKQIENKSVSDDGRYAAFEINPQKGDGVLHLYNLEDQQEVLIPRGSKSAISANGNYLVYRIRPQYDTVRAKKLEKVKKDKLPKDSLGIHLIASGQEYKYPGLKDFSLSKEPSDWMVYLLERPEEKEKEADTAVTDGADQNKSKNPARKKKDKKDKGDLLVIFNPVSGDSTAFEDVTKYAFAENGSLCAFLRVRNDSVDSVFVSLYHAGSGKTEQVFAAEGYSENIAVDRQAKRLAFTFSTDTVKNKPFDLICYDVEKGKETSVLSGEFTGLPDDWFVSQHGSLFFSQAGDELFFGTAPRPYNKPEDTLTEDEQVNVDIWNWKDPYLQSHQLKRLEREKKRSYAAVYHPREKRAVQLGDEYLENVSLDPRAEGKWSLGFSDTPYRQMISWDGSSYRDAFIINRATGERKKVLEKVASRVSLSPQQHYVAWYDITDSSWNIYHVKEGTNDKVMAGYGISFHNERNDVPNEAPPYGMAGWTADEELVLYDRYDLWLIDPKGKKSPLNLTKGEGNRSGITFRYLRLDEEERALPDTMLLSAFNESDKRAGYYALIMSTGRLDRRLYSDHYYSRPVKSRKSGVLLWTRESFLEFPDLYAGDLTFSDPLRISLANPQQADYNWGTTELVEWVSFNGDSLQGILVKPEDFDESGSYPMLVYFYERSSDRLNRYYMPKPIRSTINWSYYASNGYLIFVPDIVYREGYPGPSAYDCIISGTMALCEKYPFIDRDRLGIQGQSWGGYQTAYIITQTDLFRAAMAGAPVSNMTSAYGGIRWGTGLSRAFQYEETQSRIGATLWERRDLYILNSPLFFADRINTPLLMMHNDEDGAVPWYQGIELFTAMRRLQKPVWMLVYNKAPHNLKRWADMEDLTVRMQQFFDHYLKDAPEPVWMKHGVPATEKGRDLGLELD